MLASTAGRAALLGTSALATAALTAGLLAGSGTGWAQGVGQPSGGVVTQGSASIAYGGTATTIQQSPDRAIVQWDDFDVPTRHAVTFQQPGAASATLNRVMQGDRTDIMGALAGNGQVVVVNPRGVDTLGVVTVAGNLVALAADDGIDVDNTLGLVSIGGNTVLGVLADGIEASDTLGGVIVDDNDIFITGLSGIAISDGNTVAGSLFGDGISVENTLGLVAVTENDVLATLFGDRIDVESTLGLVHVADNFVLGAGFNGIEVTDTGGVVDIGGNDVGLVSPNGIFVDDTAGLLPFLPGLVRVADNEVEGALFGDGLLIDNTFGDILVRHNVVRRTGIDGIHVADTVGDVEATDNDVRFVDVDGLIVETTLGAVLITGNEVGDTGEDGIDVETAIGTVTVQSNTVDQTGDDGIDVDFVTDTQNTLVAENFVWSNGFAGVQANGALGAGVSLFSNSFEGYLNGGGAPYAVNNNTGGTLTAEFYWWGATNPGGASANLFLGGVDFLPFLLSGAEIGNSPFVPGFQLTGIGVGLFSNSLLRVQIAGFGPDLPTPGDATFRARLASDPYQVNIFGNLYGLGGAAGGGLGRLEPAAGPRSEKEGSGPMPS